MLSNINFIFLAHERKGRKETFSFLYNIKYVIISQGLELHKYEKD